MGDYDEVRRRLVDPIWRQVGKRFVEKAVEEGLLEIGEVAVAEEFLARHTSGWEPPDAKLLGQAPLQLEELGSFAVEFAFECQAVEEIFASDEQLWTLMASLIGEASFPTEAEIDEAYDCPATEPLPNAKLLGIGRNGWDPVVVRDDGAPTASKLGGTPYLTEEHRWPICPNCDRPMHFFLQLNFSELPLPEQERLGDTGLVQLFYCTSSQPLCELDCKAYDPFSKSVVARFVRSIDPEDAIAEIGPANPFPGRRIMGWQVLEDYPNWEERKYEVGVDLSPDEEAYVEAIGAPRPGDKLGGWPHWIQGVHYPGCSKCRSPMELVFQIDSNDNLPFMFGDSGAGHLTRCPKHPDILAFAWSCC